ncbi:hypothetical protein [Amycolatopsis sp. NPDC050768]|uniref:hypothetical protein n=1 Tax=Amycolatopsis sp. NPDC050768 TaxID=3154839 RepID=UPI0033D3FC6D
MFTQDIHNNIGRRAAIRGERSGRVWQVMRAVAGRRYLVRNIATGQCRTVDHNALSNLY